MNNFYFLVFILSIKAHAFVSGPSSISSGEKYLTFNMQSERGKVEPHENKASYQNAEIDIFKIKYVHGLDDFFGLSRSNIYFENGFFKSAKEQVGATLFYDKDQGSYLSAGVSADFVHDLDKQFGFYFQLMLNKSYNNKKFSNPRLDNFSFGLTSAYNITDNFFQRSLIHIGSGDRSEQNSYLVVDSGYGYRLNHYVDRQMTALASIFLEADTSERNDNSYDAAFSIGESKDRVRAFKYGTLLGLDLALTASSNISISYLQKLGGYDARSTQIFNLSLGYKF